MSYCCCYFEYYEDDLRTENERLRARTERAEDVLRELYYKMRAYLDHARGSGEMPREIQDAAQRACDAAHALLEEIENG